MLHSKDIFRKYDIRGVYGKNLTDSVAEATAKAFATMVYDETKKERPVLSVGRDVRFSSEALFNSVCSGLVESGIDVIDLGVCPSPLTYFSMYSEGTDGYVMITGSHNPPEFNGIKVGTKNTIYHSEKITEIFTNIINENFPSGKKEGSVSKFDVITAYKKYISDHFKALRENISKLDVKPKVIIDCGSGTASEIAPDIFRDLGVDVTELYCVPDGNFPGHHPDPTVEKNMSEARDILLRLGADLAVGYDGDADRLGALDDKGEMIWGDQLIGIFAAAIAEKHPNEKVVADVKASKGLYEYLEKIGMKSVMYLSGHSMIKEKMKQVGAILGGEMSSHIFFADRYFGFDDGIYASVRLLETYVERLLNNEISHSSQMTAGIPKYYNTPEIREACPDDIKFLVPEKLKELLSGSELKDRLGVENIIDIDGLRINFKNGWVLVRASNTEPLLVTRYEATTEEELTRLSGGFKEIIKEIIDDIQKKN